MNPTKRKTCSGGFVTAVTLSTGIIKKHIPQIKELGFQVNEIFAKHGLIKFQRNGITINGSFGNKIITLDCSNKISDKDCDNLIKETILTIENLIK